MVLSKHPGGGPIIERFLLETAIKHRNIGLKALQLFQSFSEDSGASYQERAMDFYNEMEQSLVNGDLPKKYEKPPQSLETQKGTVLPLLYEL